MAIKDSVLLKLGHAIITSPISKQAARSTTAGKVAFGSNITFYHHVRRNWILSDDNDGQGPFNRLPCKTTDNDWPVKFGEFAHVRWDRRQLERCAVLSICFCFPVDCYRMRKRGFFCC